MEKEKLPAHVLDKIIEGKLGSFYAQFVLVDQFTIRDGAVICHTDRAGQRQDHRNIQASCSVRFRVGEGNE
jgi:translation elongation factor EF-Ts